MTKPSAVDPEGTRPRLTLDGPAAYQIKVPGHLESAWAEWAGPMALATETDGSGQPVTTLTGSIDQAALLGLLRRLNALGLPLIAVCWLDVT